MHDRFAREKGGFVEEISGGLFSLVEEGRKGLGIGGGMEFMPMKWGVMARLRLGVDMDERCNTVGRTG